MEHTKVGPFQIRDRLGRRRQRVYRAFQTEQDLEVALKFIGLPKQAKRAEAIKKIKIEVDLLKELSHPNLVKMYGAGIHEDQIFFATELIDAESLTSLLTRRGKFAPDQVVECGRQIAELLEYLHAQDILHCKLTPDKVLLASDGTVKVTDLRLNRTRKRRWDSSRQRELDIAAYMAPEQFTDGATPKSDVYSLGVSLYEMLTGKLPYKPDTLGRMTRRKMREKAPAVAELAMNCPVWLDKIVGQMISPDPRHRPHTAKAVILAMDELRRLDATGKSAASQVSGNFNPLTAGQDKAEANRLLGKKMASRFNWPVIGSTVASIVVLAGVLFLLVNALLPLSPQENYQQAVALMESDESSDWRTARDHLKKIMESDGPLCADAEKLYFESKRRTLIAQAERGRIHSLQSPHTQRFIKACKLWEEGKPDLACEEFKVLVETVDPAGDERFIHTEAQKRFGELCPVAKDELEPDSDAPESEPDLDALEPKPDESP